MLLLPAEHYSDLRHAIRDLQSRYPLKRHEIRCELDRILSEFMPRCKPISADQLIDTEAYGYLGFSDRATAFAPMGHALRHHGDVYVYVYRWQADRQRFLSINAWGFLEELRPQEVKGFLIAFRQVEG